MQSPLGGEPQPVLSANTPAFPAGSLDVGAPPEPTVPELLAMLERARERQRKQDIQTDILRGQLARRTKMLAEQRALFLKQLLVLKEQIFQRNRLGEPYQPDLLELFNPQAWVDSLMSEEGEGDEEKRRKELVDKMTARFNEERAKMEQSAKTMERELNSKLLALDRELKHKDIEWQQRLDQAEEQRKTEVETMRKQWRDEVARLTADYEKQIAELQQRLISETDRLNREWEAKLNKAVEEQRALQEQLRTELAAAQKEIAAKEAEIQQMLDKFEQFEKQLREKTEALEKVTAEKDRLQVQFESARDSLEKAENEVRELRLKVAKLEEEGGAEQVAKFKKIAEEANARCAKLEAESGGAMAEVGRLKAALEAAQDENKKMQAEMEERIRKLQEADEELRKRGVPPAAVAVAGPPAALGELREAVDKNKELIEKRAAGNWALMSRGLMARDLETRVQDLKAKAAAEPDDEDEFAMTEEERERLRISKLNVFDRLIERARLLMERLKSRKALLEQERQRNLERVLAAACLLVRPLPQQSPSVSKGPEGQMFYVTHVDLAGTSGAPHSPLPGARTSSRDSARWRPAGPEGVAFDGAGQDRSLPPSVLHARTPNTPPLVRRPGAGGPAASLATAPSPSGRPTTAPGTPAMGGLAPASPSSDPQTQVLPGGAAAGGGAGVPAGLRAPSPSGAGAVVTSMIGKGGGGGNLSLVQRQQATRLPTPPPR